MEEGLPLDSLTVHNLPTGQLFSVLPNGFVRTVTQIPQLVQAYSKGTNTTKARSYHVLEETPAERPLPCHFASQTFSWKLLTSPFLL